MAKSQRLKLEAILKELLGSSYVYFQPPEDVHMIYPCIVYARDKVARIAADNLPYRVVQGYQVTYIDKKPDSDVIDKLLNLPLTEFERHFATSGLNHDVFTIYH